MKIYCGCPDQEKALFMAGSPINPCYVVQYQGEIVQRHYACAPDSMKERLGCPCDCHLALSEEGKPLMAWCSFCPVKHEGAPDGN